MTPLDRFGRNAIRVTEEIINSRTHRNHEHYVCETLGEMMEDEFDYHEEVEQIPAMIAAKKKNAIKTVKEKK